MPLKAYRKGEGSNLSFQGLFILKEGGRIDPAYSDRAFSRWNLLRWLFFSLEKIFLSAVGCGFKLDQAILLLPELRRADIIVTTADSAGLPVLFLKKIGLIRAPVVYVSFGLASSLQRSSLWVLRFFRAFFSSASFVISYAQSEADIFQNMHLARNVKAVPFGVDTNFYHEKIFQEKRTLIVSIGRDPERDYGTLFSAVDGLDLQVIVICSPRNVQNLRLPRNVEVLQDIPEYAVREYFAKAKHSIIPINTIDRPAGQIVLLESFAMEVPTIVSSVPGIKATYPFEHKKHCYFVKPKDPKELRRAIEWILMHPHASSEMAQRGANLVRKQFTQQHFAKAMEKIILRIWRHA